MSAIGQVKEYAAHIFLPDDVVELRAIATGGRVRKFWDLARDLPRLVPEFEQLNRAGFNIYVGVNPRAAKGLSGDNNIAVCRCLFTDFDHIEPGDGCGRGEFVEARIEENRLPMPTFTVHSGHGIHTYWVLDTPLPPERWKGVQERLIATLNADKACSNAERLLRLPGFLNHKSEPSVECFTMFAGTP